MHWLLFFQIKVSTSRRVVLNELCAGDSVSSNVERMTRERPPGLHSPSYVVKPAITISIHYNHLAFQWGFVVLVEPCAAAWGLGDTYLQGLCSSWRYALSPVRSSPSTTRSWKLLRTQRLTSTGCLGTVTTRELFHISKSPTLTNL